MGVTIAANFRGGEVEEDPPERRVFRFRAGGDFILDSPSRPRAVWGAGDDVLVAEGEATILAGGQGLGKTTIAGQYALGRCGFSEYRELLGYPIQAGSRRVLYLAMDRPRQAARSLRRMVGEAWRDELNAKLSIWPGPPPYDLAKHPSLLTTLCQDADADTVIVDSLKDAAIGLVDDEVGAGWNRGRQLAVAEGIEVLELHHQRKLARNDRGKPGIDDLYGSTWITSGAGSVLMLTGSPGDPVVFMHHLKQPASEVGPLTLLHDHEVGRTTIYERADLAALAAAEGSITALRAAEVMFDTAKPTKAEKEKARRKLDSLTRAGLLTVSAEGDIRANRAATWSPK